MTQTPTATPSLATTVALCDYDYSGFEFATHAGPHLDEHYVFWLAVHFARLPARCVPKFPVTRKDIEALPERTLFVGIEQDEFDEHKQGGRQANASAASLATERFWVADRAELRPLLEAIHLGDTQGDTHAFGLDGLLKVATQLNTHNQQLHRELGVRICRAFDALVGYQSPPYQPLPAYSGPEVGSCQTADQLLAVWDVMASETEHQNLDEAMRKVRKNWNDTSRPCAVIHLKNVTQALLDRFGPQEAYALMVLLLDAYLVKQLDVLGHGRCNDEWRQAEKFLTSNGLKVALVRTESPFMMGHLRARRDLRADDKMPDLVVVRMAIPGRPVQTSVWSFSERAKDLLAQVTTRVGRREFKLSGGATQLQKDRFSQALDEVATGQVSRNLPGTANNWYLFMTGRDGETKGWGLINGTHTRVAPPTRINTVDAWKDVLIHL